MRLDTLVLLGALVVVALGLWRSMGKNFDKLDTKIDEARKEAKTDNEKLRQEFKTQIGSLRPHVDIVFACIDEHL